MRLSRQDFKKEIEFFNSFLVEDEILLQAQKEIFELVRQEIQWLNLKGLGLEGGCGFAIFGRELIKINQDVSLIGVDINKKLISEVNKIKPVRYKVIWGNLAERKLFGKAYFDFILFPYVLHHIPETRKIINNAYFWLKPNGKLIILEPNGSNPILNLSYILRCFLQKFLKNWTDKYASPNEKNISPVTFGRLFKGLFEVLTIKTFLVNSTSSNNPSSFDIVFKTLADIRMLLLKMYNHLRFSPYWGSDILIIARKYSPAGQKI